LSSRFKHRTATSSEMKIQFLSFITSCYSNSTNCIELICSLLETTTVNLGRAKRIEARVKAIRAQIEEAN
jgi:hypothetical protein